MTLRNPVVTDPKDAMTLITIWWASLDELWAWWARSRATCREQSGTIGRPRPSAHSSRRATLPAEPQTQGQGGHDLCSLRPPGIPLSRPIPQNVQYETVRKSVTWIGNINEGASYSGAPTTDAPPTVEPFESSSPTRRKWFARFMQQGVKLRMGQVRYQNEPLTSEMSLLWTSSSRPSKWHRTTDDRERERLEELMCYVLIGFGASLSKGSVVQEGPPGGLAVCQEGREDKGPDQGLRQGLCLLHGGPEGEPTGAVLGRHIDGALLPSSLDAPWGVVLMMKGKVASTIVNMINRWRTKEGTKGSAPGLSMEQPTRTCMRDAIHLMIQYWVQGGNE
ncbi:hypothetical protein THAOC_25226 [Thalassiosira oceanica]|uniref:Uncharacterized protein n=1 Tax=Thalassiosira oceanica TaxID=159749 RepID=K0RMU8_THAOC|nr:hypothetical protein THAOC_25226 [Thalassiosira oceanica]|eukprot:EJK55078.1 hypothetical protein THAOC_25226 [Thalassiosira oceanica]